MWRLQEELLDQRGPRGVGGATSDSSSRTRTHFLVGATPQPLHSLDLGPGLSRAFAAVASSLVSLLSFTMFMTTSN